MQKSVCPLCLHHSFMIGHIRAKNRLYHYCENCGLIRACEDTMLDPGSEKSRYLLHDNTPGNREYRRYMIAVRDTLILPQLPPRAAILDFGSGPYPLLSHLCIAAGYSTAYYDKFFDSSPGALDTTYDAITLIEVLEHIDDTRKTIELLLDLLVPSGLLIVKTMFHHDDAQLFANWWYIEDLTHIAFFSEKTFLYLAEEFDLSIVKNDKKSSIIFRKNT